MRRRPARWWRSRRPRSCANSSQKSTDCAPRARPPTAHRGTDWPRSARSAVRRPRRRARARRCRGFPPAAAARAGSAPGSPAPRPTARSASRDVRRRLASNGRKISWPLALLAVSSPTTRPRWRRTSGSPPRSPGRPCRRPSRRRPARPRWRRAPMARARRQLPPAPSSSSTSEASTVRRSPIVCISAAANGPIRPPSRMFSEIAPEIVAALQPNACSSGTISTPGAARTPTVARITDEHDADDDPAVVEAARQQAGQAAAAPSSSPPSTLPLA